MGGALERLIESLGPRMHQGLFFGCRVVVVRDGGTYVLLGAGVSKFL